MEERLYLREDGRPTRNISNPEDPLRVRRREAVNAKKARPKYKRLKVQLPEVHSMWKNARCRQIPMEVRELNDHRKRDRICVNYAMLESVASALEEAEAHHDPGARDLGEAHTEKNSANGAGR